MLNAEIVTSDINISNYNVFVQRGKNREKIN